MGLEGTIIRREKLTRLLVAVNFVQQGANTRCPFRQHLSTRMRPQPEFSSAQNYRFAAAKHRINEEH